MDIFTNMILPVDMGETPPTDQWDFYNADFFHVEIWACQLSNSVADLTKIFTIVNVEVVKSAVNPQQNPHVTHADLAANLLCISGEYHSEKYSLCVDPA